jgi:sulfur carrier protein ThiS
MHVRVKLLGTLSSLYQGPYTPEGIGIEIPDGATVADLVNATGIARERVAIVTINGLLAKGDDRVPENAVVKFMQPVTGG